MEPRKLVVVSSGWTPLERKLVGDLLIKDQLILGGMRQTGYPVDESVVLSIDSAIELGLEQITECLQLIKQGTAEQLETNREMFEDYFERLYERIEVPEWTDTVKQTLLSWINADLAVTVEALKRLTNRHNEDPFRSEELTRDLVRLQHMQSMLQNYSEAQLERLRGTFADYIL